MGKCKWLKKSLLLFAVLGTLACGVIGGVETISENDILNASTDNQTVVEEQPSESGENLASDVEVSAPTEIVPTPTAEPTPQPTPPEPFQYTILEQRLVVEKNGKTLTDVTCGRFLVEVVGLAKNDTNFVLQGPDIYIEAYDDEELIDRFRIGHTHSTFVQPGSEMIFNSGLPKCADLRSLPMEDSQLEYIDFRIGLYAREKPAYDESVPYTHLEIISVLEKPRDEGMKLEVTLKNTGDEPAYVFLHYIFYDLEGQVIDANYISVYSDVEPWFLLLAGDEITTNLYSWVDISAYDVFLRGMVVED
jgi:hypothetical protein